MKSVMRKKYVRFFVKLMILSLLLSVLFHYYSIEFILGYVFVALLLAIVDVLLEGGEL